jgi:hypothetical protein
MTKDEMQAQANLQRQAAKDILRRILLQQDLRITDADNFVDCVISAAMLEIAHSWVTAQLHTSTSEHP